MKQEQTPDIKGEFPAPAGNYSISLKDGRLSVLSEQGPAEIPTTAVVAVGVGWAVPAKGGGYEHLLLVLADGTEKVLFMSEGYSCDVVRSYMALGKNLAERLNVAYRDVPLGADA
jgi:hypothetical protein